MTDVEKIETSRAPKAIGPYSQAVLLPCSKKLVFVSGQIPINPASGKLVDGGIREMTNQSINNLEAILLKAGSSLQQVSRVDIFLTDLAKDFAAVNEEYQKRFNGSIHPARQTVEVAALPMESSIEISCIAYVDEEGS